MFNLFQLMFKTSTYRLASGLIMAIWLLSACSIFEGGDEASVATEEAPPPETDSGDSTIATAEPTVAVTPIATEPAEPTQPTNLIVWVVKPIFPEPDTAGGEVLAELFDSFQGNHPDLNIKIEEKNPSGRGGTLSYLRSGRDIASNILPDLIVLPVDLLATAAGEELIYPLDDLLDQDMMEDLFPAADSMARVDNTIFGYPLTLTDLHHATFNSTVFTDTLPTTWEALLAFEDAELVFPAAGPGGAELALQLYLASGGQLVGESNQPALEIEPLTNALNQLSRGRNEGLIVTESGSVTTFGEALALFNSGSANAAQTEATLLLNESANVTESGHAPMPGLEEPLAPYVRGWALSISTPDTLRQSLAVELLNWLASAQNIGRWTLEGSLLPSRRSAFEVWPAEEPYIDFLQSHLEFAEPFPKDANNAVMSVLSTAVFEVISQGKSPQVAAEDAASALTS